MDLRAALNSVFAVTSDVVTFVLLSFEMVSCEYRLEMYLRISILEFVGTYGLVRIGH